MVASARPTKEERGEELTEQLSAQPLEGNNNFGNGTEGQEIWKKLAEENIKGSKQNWEDQ